MLFDHIGRYGEPSARRLFSNRLVNEAQHLSGAPAPEPRLLHLGAVVSGGEVSGVDLARQALLAAREAAKKNGAARQKPKGASPPLYGVRAVSRSG
ncbi:hypothetical protein OG728_02145 [Streptomyces microflavus]|uniref:hypothetical protein n=1 Tax=Streptomyces microflavus TaxID=1919 RepID=UPI002E109C31|nr:hypothetical protein OG728_02145 [Streptomyces microflavus]